MKEHYVSYDCAKRLKALGFRWKVDRYYTYWYESEDPEDDAMTATLHRSGLHDHNGIFNNPIYEDGIHYSAPRLDQAAAWMRDKGIHISLNPYSISPDRYDGDNYFWSFELLQLPTGGWLKVNEGGFDTYESALSAGIDKALELLGKEEKE